MNATLTSPREAPSLDGALRLELERVRLLLDGRRNGELGLVDARRRVALQTLAEAGRPAPVELLSFLFGLTPFERDVLVLCLAAALDTTVPEPTPQLVYALLGGPPDTLLPDAPLRRFRLVGVEHDGSPPGRRPLRLDDRIHDFLLGFDRLDERVARVLRPLEAAPVPPSHKPLVEPLARWLRSTGLREPWPALNLVGPPRSGKSTLALAIAARAGLGLLRLAPDRLPQIAAERDELLRLVDREAILRQFVVYAALPEPDGASELDEIGAPLIVGSTARRRTERRTVAARIPALDTRDRIAVWREALGTADAELEPVGEQFHLSPREVVEIAAQAAAPVMVDGRAPSLWEACREHAVWPHGALAQRIVPTHDWADLVLPDGELAQLRELAAQVRNRARVYGDWRFGERLVRGRGISALFAGPSGTGKTLAAEIVAGEVELDLYRIDLAGVVDKYIGETEKNLRRVFDAAEASGAVLFFDEADALFGKRTEVKDSHDRYANIELNYLLQRIEDYHGLAILATNRKSMLDEAFLRRLRFVVDFPLPDAKQREAIWRVAFPLGTPTDGLDFRALALLDLTGGNIASIALNASFLAADEGAAVAMRHLYRAATREYAKIDKLVLETEFGPCFAGVER
jgi:SpoVK/Ycf46/Vps4 family AAA+-type ATPase